MDENDGEEFVLQELFNSRSFIDEIIGVKTNEDVLDKLFGEFCIGK
jgi:tRNA U34 5-carboxymethylaminomethyl modifying GTPase MnmE/TrmE